jgi:hypothetical protein
MIDIQVHNARWLDHIADCRKNQVPQALKTGVNILATNVQGVERRHMKDIFEERRPEWLDRSVKITHFATKAEPWATIGIHPPGGDARADVITKFEDETEKLPRGATLAIPIDVRRNKRDIVLNSQRPTALRSNARVFVIRKANGVGLILQRITRGANKGTNRLLYLLVPRARIHPDLHFEENAKRTVDVSWPTAFDKAWDDTMRTAK